MHVHGIMSRARKRVRQVRNFILNEDSIRLTDFLFASGSNMAFHGTDHEHIQEVFLTQLSGG